MKSKPALLVIVLCLIAAFGVFVYAQNRAASPAANLAPAATAPPTAPAAAPSAAASTGGLVTPPPVTAPTAADSGPVPALARKIEIGRALPQAAKECIECHARQEPGRMRDWSQSVMARANVGCLDCHRAEPTDKDAMDCPGTLKYRDQNLKITPVVTPSDCGRCHPREEEQFARSKHARTFEIQTAELKDAFLRGMANEIERSVGCWNCHGSDLSSGQLTELNWPSEGCGRLNPDGSKGSCVICHTAHHFNIMEARRPETCGQCHLGPDHPQDEIYFESKHGKRYLAEGDLWNYAPAPDLWEPGADFTAPTCAVCHLAGVGPLATTHDVGERLKWETQLPLSVPNKDFDGDQARARMTAVCQQCHSPRWSKNYLARFDLTIANYNDNYFKPAKAIMDDLYAKKLLTAWPVFDEEIEWVFYEYWHHEGRRARMGAMMMGPDYAWWHGFYEMKRHYQELVRLAEEARRNGNGSPVYVPGAGGRNLTPADSPALPAYWKEIKNLKGMPPTK
jgi:hypothetical protein